MKVEVIIPKKPLFDVGLFQRLAAAQMGGVAQGVKRDFEATVKTWDNKPIFTISYSKEEAIVGTDSQEYAWVNDGTKKNYPIVPRKAGGRLVFQRGYKAKTTIGTISSRQGGKFGDVIKARAVVHPGIEGRHFDKLIDEKWKRPFLSRMVQAVIDANR